MVTLRINVIALILVGTFAWISVWILKQDGFSYLQMFQVALPVFIAIRVYDYIAGLPAFKGKNKKEGGK